MLIGSAENFKNSWLGIRVPPQAQMMADYTNSTLEIHKYYSISYEFETETKFFVLEFLGITEVKNRIKFNRYKVLCEGRIDYINLTPSALVKIKELSGC